jgi:hypothetical protein
MKAQMVGVEVWLYSSFTSALPGGEWLTPPPSQIIPKGAAPIPIAKGAEWTAGPVWTGVG